MDYYRFYNNIYSFVEPTKTTHSSTQTSIVATCKKTKLFEITQTCTTKRMNNLKGKCSPVALQLRAPPK